MYPIYTLTCTPSVTLHMQYSKSEESKLDVLGEEGHNYSKQCAKIICQNFVKVRYN